MGRLDGKVALITGAGSGMGGLAASCSRAEGAKVVVATTLDGDADARRSAGDRGRGWRGRDRPSST